MSLQLAKSLHRNVVSILAIYFQNKNDKRYLIFTINLQVTNVKGISYETPARKGKQKKSVSYKYHLDIKRKPIGYTIAKKRDGCVVHQHIQCTFISKNGISLFQEKDQERILCSLS